MIQLGSILKQVFISLLSGMLGAAIVVVYYIPPSEYKTEYVKDYYASEVAVSVSPQTVKKYIDEKKTDYILVDLRSAAEYEKEHAVTAINIPAASMNEEQLVAAFKNLDPDKEIITHCYSAYCTLARQVGNALAQNGIYVKEMTIGWSEWRYHWDIWNPGASKEDGKDYVTSGKSNSVDTPIAPCTQGEFGC